MVQPARKSNPRLHAGHRNYSGGSTKAGLNNLQFTQKDRVPSKSQLKPGNGTADVRVSVWV